MNRLLFLCTGNYYRSRFAEQYFNHHADAMNLPWRAYSMGLLRDMQNGPNIGPISNHTLDYLTTLGIDWDDSRYPESVEQEHFDQYDRVIAASRDEHYPMMQEHFQHLADDIEYFEVEDLHIESSELALPKLVAALDRLLEEIQVA
ncbi:low molecular weight phosphatase family protein [Sessilibacter corallicola]|uniref:Low molecular weight phosphatase family protein n=1 Tax=Sessilibacter corallicola TaxID=2904075 RepID=A0ABQ0A8F4_9GAMM